MNATVFKSTHDMTHEEWLQVRTKGIGGSDASIIAGINKWKSPMGLYLEKVGQSPLESTAGEAAYWGNTLEELVAQEFSKRTGFKIRKRNAILQHPEHSFMLANVDRLIVGVNEGLECKTASEYLKKEWENEEIPAAYLLQCQHYMAVTGYQAWWIAVLIGGNKFIYKKVDRDEELISYLIDIEKNFWENHVMKGVPPEIDGSQASSDLLNALYPNSYESEIELPEEVSTYLDALEQVNSELKSLDERKKEYENKIKQVIGDNEKGYWKDKTITWKTVKSTRLDNKKFKEEQPDLFQKYAKETSYRRFQIK
ncbi:YqaJ viral recombinase family protein [Alkalihalobacillus sp. BA299]|uniref:YqaJ viral recombinase family nuclease n=1 Tax=Alkalihalobacillus sp. BA299 TaxID=2815938 RepID=UPI0035AB8C0E